MKKLVVLIILLLGIKGFSQHPELLDTTWYLHKMIIDGMEHLPPNNWEVDSIELICEGDYLLTGVCNFIEVTVLYNTDNQTFVVLGVGSTLLDCSVYENTLFEIMYVLFFQGSVEEVCTYNITINGTGDKSLVVINNDGNEAHYSSVPLSTEDFNDLSVSIYPNPVKELLFIESKENISSITVFDIHGKKVKTVNAQSEINLSGLQSGVYFVSITSENGGVLTQKIVKK